eukprot:snap_masked-scaffold_13-processed-gene-6.56-mRNA-1 protein AED:1.00 eAED:1.00 QI:0/-1/0/0/-1/1/1/0/427
MLELESFLSKEKKNWIVYRTPCWRKGKVVKLFLCLISFCLIYGIFGENIRGNLEEKFFSRDLKNAQNSDEDDYLSCIKSIQERKLRVQENEYNGMGNVNEGKTYIFLAKHTNRAFTNESFCKIYRRAPYSVYSRYGELIEYNQDNILELEFLITGVGRSGTSFMVAEFNNLNLHVSHDNNSPTRNREIGSVSWPNSFNEKVCKREPWNFPTLPTPHVRYKHIFHLIRSPLKQINSRADAGGFAYKNFVSITCNVDYFKGYEIAHDSMEERIRHFRNFLLNKEVPEFHIALILALRHWVLFNSFVASYSELTFKIEVMDHTEEREAILRFLLEKAEVSHQPSEVDWHNYRSKAVDSKLNSAHTHKIHNFELKWSLLHKLDAEFTAMAQIIASRFGYEIDEREVSALIHSNSDIKCYFLKSEQWTCDLV